MKEAAMIEAVTKYEQTLNEANNVYQAALLNEGCDFAAALAAVEFARKNALLAYEKDTREVKKAVALASLLSTTATAKDHAMNIVTPVTPVTPVAQVTPAHGRFLAAESAAWDAYEAALAGVQEIQDALVAAGSSVLQAYRAVQWRRNAACNALDDALATASAEYGDHKKD